MLILDPLQGYREHLQIVLGYRAGTVARYTSALRIFAEWIVSSGRAPTATIEAVTQDAITDWMKHLYYHGGNQQNVSRAGKVAALKSFWKYLRFADLVSSNPVAAIPYPKPASHAAQKFGEKQLRKIFAPLTGSSPADIRDRALLMLMYGAGPRVSEIVHLNVDNLHEFSAADLRVEFGDTKGAGYRMVSLSPTPARALREWLIIRAAHVAAGDADAQHALFLSLSKSDPGHRLGKEGISRMLKRVAEGVGINDERVFVHKMRSTFATDLYDLGYGIKEISLQMGHKSVKATERYIAISEKALRQTRIPESRWRKLTKKEEPADAEK